MEQSERISTQASKSQLKRCSHCKRLLVVSSFSKDRTKKDGLECWCKACKGEKDKRYSQTERGKLMRRKAIRRYRQTESGKAKEKERNKRWQSSEAGKAAQRRYYEKYKKEFPLNTKEHLRGYLFLKALRQPDVKIVEWRKV